MQAKLIYRKVTNTAPVMSYSFGTDGFIKRRVSVTCNMVSSATFYLVFKKVTVRLARSCFVWYSPLKALLNPWEGEGEGGVYLI